MRSCVFLILAGALALSAAEPETITLQGRLLIRPEAPVILETATHSTVELDGDAPTRKVLHDARISGMTVQATGHYTAPGKFLLDAQHSHALVVHKDDKFKMITYWCKVCGIRSYTPGPCVCCEGETDLDLRDPDETR